jgi:D-amino peptidase
LSDALAREGVKQMKVFVMVDMEGISGICRESQVINGKEHYAAGRRYMTWDVNACVAGCLAGGARKVVVRDAHYMGYNLIWEELDPRAEYIQGSSPRERMPDIGAFDGLILLGYHAMAGVPEAILEHTMSPERWQNFYMNGVKRGEVAIDAGIAGDHGVPVIMVSGDDKLCREARRFLKNVVTAEVKKGLALEGGQLLPKERAHEVIRQAAEQACRTYRQMKPFKVRKPVRMRLEVVSRGRLPVGLPDAKILDGRTYEVTGRTVEEALNRLR